LTNGKNAFVRVKTDTGSTRNHIDYYRYNKNRKIFYWKMSVGLYRQ